MTHNNYRDLLEEARLVYTKSILREHISRQLTETILIVEDTLDRELSKDEIENILILLTDK